MAIIPKSRTGSKELKHNATRKEKATPVSHFKTIEKSTTGSGQLAGTARTESATSFSHFKTVGKSGSDGMGAPRAVKKWHKKISLDSKLGG